MRVRGAHVMTQTLLEAALEYAHDGWEVFPLNADKTPRTTNGMKDATSDTEQVERWWTSAPDSLIGCRIPEGVMVLDIDPRHDGHLTWSSLTTLHGDIDTRRHYSGRSDGGFHIWLTRPEGKLSAKGLADHASDLGVTFEAGGGIDILHHGHRYTILPPSPHAATGAPYWWGDGSPDVAECPDWLAALVVTPERPLAAPVTRRDYQGASVADWWTETTTWPQILGRHGWEVVAGDGDSDGSRWRHPSATNAFSATISNGCLFVYTDRTPFDMTADGDPHGYTRFRAMAVLEHGGDLKAAARAASEAPGAPSLPDGDLSAFIAANTPDEPPEGHNPLQPWAVEWGEFWQTDHKAEDFLCAPLLARGRGHALYAKAKTGKSLLTLEMAAAIASGRPFLDMEAGEPRHVVYVDYEMTSDDLAERLEAFGYGPGDDLSHLHYVQMPAIDTLDTAAGGRAVVAAATAWGAELVVVDTTARAVAGEENAMETFRDFYRHTFMPLKAAGITTLRVDHAGKDTERGQRGSSAKNDDVDVVWELGVKGEPGAGDQTLTVKATHRRMGWIPGAVEITRRDDGHPMHVLPEATEKTYAAGTREKVDEMDAAGVPLNATRRDVRSTFGIGGTDRVIGDALRFRRERNVSSLTARMKATNTTESAAPSSAPSSAPHTPHQAPHQAAPSTKALVRGSHQASHQDAPTSPGNPAPSPLSREGLVRTPPRAVDPEGLI